MFWVYKTLIPSWLTYEIDRFNFLESAHSIVYFLLFYFKEYFSG